jgi:hypothetical protein
VDPVPEISEEHFDRQPKRKAVSGKGTESEKRRKIDRKDD